MKYYNVTNQNNEEFIVNENELPDNYPDYEKIIPDDNDTEEHHYDAKELKKQIGMIKGMADKTTKEIILKKNEIKAGGSNYHASITINYSLPEIHLNCNYLYESLAMFKQAIICVVNRYTAIKIYEGGKPDRFKLIMPLRS